MMYRRSIVSGAVAAVMILALLTGIILPVRAASRNRSADSAYGAQSSASYSATSNSNSYSCDDPIASGLVRGANFDLDSSNDSCGQYSQNTRPSESGSGAYTGIGEDNYSAQSRGDRGYSTPSRNHTYSSGSYGDNSSTTSADSYNNSDTTSSTSGEYVALGDSVAAGDGLPSTQGSDPACSVSNQAYPSIVAASLGMPYRNLACSGATAGDLVSEQHLTGTSRDIEPQLDTAFANGTPRLVTITAGANDIYWDFYVRKCYLGECGTSVDRASLGGLKSVLSLKIDYVLQTIQNKSNGQPPRVVLTGYFWPLSAECSTDQSGLTATEVSWLNQQLQDVNNKIQQAASSYSFARYAPVSFVGHELCTAQPWVQDAAGDAPLHPTAQGQQAIADAVSRLAR